MNGFLALTDKAPENTGARMSGTASDDIVVEEPEKPVTEIVTSLGTWVTGSDSMSKVVDGKVAMEANEKRISLTDALVVTEGNTYEAKVKNPAFRLIVRKLAAGRVSTFYLADTDRFTAEKDALYFVSVHNVYNNYKNLTFEEYVSLFETETIGFELADVTEQVALEKTEWNQTLSTGQNVTWVSGTYSTSKASLEANKNRIRMTEALDVTVGKTYAASIKWNGKAIKDFRFIIRDVSAAGVKTMYKSNGETFVAEEGHTYYVTTQNIYGNYTKWNFQDYYREMSKTDGNALVFDFVEK